MAENPMTEKEYSQLRRIIKPFAKLNVFLYKLSRGRLLGKFKGKPIMLVEMTGAKSGEKRTLPLMYVPYKGGVIIVGSQGGAPKSPVWVKNLEANGDIVIQYRSTKTELRARRASDEEKAKVWPVCLEHYPQYDEYQARTDRNIPVYICEPR